MNKGDTVTFRRDGRTFTGTYAGPALKGRLLVKVAQRAAGPGRLVGLVTMAVRPEELLDDTSRAE